MHHTESKLTPKDSFSKKESSVGKKTAICWGIFCNVYCYRNQCIFPFIVFLMMQQKCKSHIVLSDKLRMVTKSHKEPVDRSWNPH